MPFAMSQHVGMGEGRGRGRCYPPELRIGVVDDTTIRLPTMRVSCFLLSSIGARRQQKYWQVAVSARRL